MFKKINNKIEKMFDQSSSFVVTSHNDLVSENNNVQFLNNTNLLENLSYIFSSEITPENLPQLFSQLSSYFEIGLLLKRHPNSTAYRTLNTFAFQQELTLPESVKNIKLPQSGIFKVLKTSAFGLLSHFNLNHLDPQKKMNSYLIPISIDYSIIVMTQVAEPWAGLKIEALQKTLMKINFSL